MTDFLVAAGSNFHEYGYGVGYGLSYGSWSYPYSARAWDLPPTPDNYNLLFKYPNEMGMNVQLPGEGDIQLSKKETDPVGAVTDSLGAVSAGLAIDLPLVARPPTLDYSGAVGTSVQRNFLYDTIHITPNFVNLGVVSAEAVATVVIWNAFLTDKTTSTILAYNAEGIDNNLSPLLPVTLFALDEMDWVFTVDANTGDSSIQATFRLVVDGIGYDVEFTGVRAASWAFTHNWKDPLTETLEWLTSVRTTYDGKEARAALRDVARRGLDMTLYLDRTDVKRMENVLFKWQAKNLLVPFPQYRSTLTAASLAGDTTLYLDTTMKGFAPSGNLVILNEITKEVEVATVLSVPGTNDSVVLQGPTSLGWSKGASVYPAAGAIVKGNVPLTWQTQNFAEGKVAFEFSPTFTEPLTPYEAPSDLYRGEEVLTQEPDWTGGLGRDFAFSGGIVDSSTGVITPYETHTRPSRTTSFRWLLKGDTEIYDFRKFLYRRRGMAVSFWMPSWANDFLSITKNYASGDATFRFYDNGYYLNSSGVVERQHLQIQLKNGSVIRSKIVSSTSISPTVTEVALSSVMGQGFSSEDIVRASYLSRYRLGSDAIAIEWQHPKLAAVTLPLVTVPDYQTQDAV